MFMVKDGTLLTPHADYCLPGVTRGNVMRIARSLSIPVCERRISLAEFHSADEVFTTGTMGELTPVRSIDGRTIGGDSYGKDYICITRILQEAYYQETCTLGTPLP